MNYLCHFFATRADEWSNPVQEDGAWSGTMENPGKRFFLELGAKAVRKVNGMCDAAGLSYAREAIIRCGLSLDVSGRWHEKHLFLELQQIMSKYPRHFEGVPVPTPGAEPIRISGADIMPQ